MLEQPHLDLRQPAARLARPADAAEAPRRDRRSARPGNAVSRHERCVRPAPPRSPPKRSAPRCCSRRSSAPASWPSGWPDGNDAVALLGNTMATGAILVVLITMLGADLRRAFQSGGDAGLRAPARDARRASRWPTSLVQVAGGDRRVPSRARDVRPAAPAGLDEACAAGPGNGSPRRGDLRPAPTILGAARFRRRAVPAGRSGSTSPPAYWFTASTSFANPAVDDRARPDRHLCRHPAGRCARASSGRRSSARSSGRCCFAGCWAQRVSHSLARPTPRRRAGETASARLRVATNRHSTSSTLTHATATSVASAVSASQTIR